jgi:hypothetical protein
VVAENFFDQTTNIGRLRRAAYQLLRQHEASGEVPTSTRFLFYELVQLGVVAKQRMAARRADQDLIDAIFDLREAGSVPWNYIVDETRTMETPFVAPTVRGWLLAALDSDEPMLDPWYPQRRPMILTESRSLAGVLRAILRQYSVIFAATDGQVGGFLRTEVAPRLEEDDRVLYRGDLDLAGEQHIEANTRRVLERLVGPLRWERLALTRRQVLVYNVPPMVKKDRRFKGEGGVHEAYETEALSQTVIVGIVRDRLDELLPESLEAVLERRDQERIAARGLLG